MSRWKSATTGEGGIQAKVEANLHTTLDSIYGPNRPVKSATDYARMDNAITKFFAGNPEATIKQAEDFWDQLVSEKVKFQLIDIIRKQPGVFGPFGLLGPISRRVFPQEVAGELSAKEVSRNIEKVRGLKALSPTNITTNPEPKKYPDVVRNEQFKMWTIIRDGRLRGIK